MIIDGFDEEVLENLKRDLNCIANCVGYEMFKNKVKTETNEQGISQVWLDEDDINLVYATSRRILKEMIILGWTKTTDSQNIVTGDCGCSCNSECGCNGCDCTSYKKAYKLSC